LRVTAIYVTHDQIEAMTMGTRIAVMKDGLLLQLDTPQTIYDHPANIFVAGFIGSPAMNFFDAGVFISGDQVSLRSEHFCCDVSGSLAKALLPQGGKEVVVGIRPEYLSHRPEGEGWIEIPSVVDVVESMGSEKHVLLSSGGKSYVAKMDVQVDARIGEKFSSYFPLSRMRAFDKESTNSLLSA